LRIAFIFLSDDTADVCTDVRQRTPEALARAAAKDEYAFSKRLRLGKCLVENTCCSP